MPKQLDDRVEQMLHVGEEILVSEAIEDALVVITDTRVLVFSPDKSAKRFYSVYRPNVTGFNVTTGGEASNAMKSVRTGTYSVLLLGAGVFIDLEGIIDPIAAPNGVGISGMLSAINTVIFMLGFLDEILLFLGLISLSITSWYGIRYFQSRERNLSITVAGDSSIRIPIEPIGNVEPGVERLNRAIETTSMAQSE